MNFKNILFFLSLALAVVSFDVYAVDPSICNPGAKIILHDNGSLKSCDLKDDYKANNIPCNKGRVSFYDNGVLESCDLTDDYKANNIPCNKGRVSFYANGVLESCVLSKPTTIDENKCDQLGLIYFYPDGRLKSCMKSGN